MPEDANLPVSRLWRLDTLAWKICASHTQAHPHAPTHIETDMAARLTTHTRKRLKHNKPQVCINWAYHCQVVWRFQWLSGWVFWFIFSSAVTSKSFPRSWQSGMWHSARVTEKMAKKMKQTNQERLVILQQCTSLHSTALHSFHARIVPCHNVPTVTHIPTLASQ